MESDLSKRSSLCLRFQTSTLSWSHRSLLHPQAPPTSHARESLHTWLHVENKHQAKTPPAVEKDNYPQPSAFTPQATGLGALGNTGTPLPSPRRTPKQLREGTAGTASRSDARLYRHSGPFTTRGEKQGIEPGVHEPLFGAISLGRPAGPLLFYGAVEVSAMRD